MWPRRRVIATICNFSPEPARLSSPHHRIAERGHQAVLEEGAFMSRHVVKAGLLVLFLAAAVQPAIAQRTTGEIIGKTSDESGAVMPGVTVTLRGAAIQGAQTDVTSAT